MTRAMPHPGVRALPHHGVRAVHDVTQRDVPGRAVTAVMGCRSPLTAMGVSDATSRGGVRCYDVVRDPALLVAQVARQRPDLCLVVAPYVDDLPDLVAQLLEASRSTRTVVLADEDAPPAEVLAALRAGAHGWLPLGTGGSGLVGALHAVARGEAAVPRRLLSTVLDEMRAVGSRSVVRPDGSLCELPPREHDVLLGLADGLSTAEVAARLHIGVATARGYVASAVRRLGVPDRARAVDLVRGARTRSA